MTSAALDVEESLECSPPTYRLHPRLCVVLLFLLLVCLTLVLASCSGGNGNGEGDSRASPPMPSGVQADDPQLLQGRRVFAANCARCHGTSGQGGFGPTFRDGRLLRDFPSPEDQMALVGAGRGSMPSFAGTLTDAQIRAVVRYERDVLSDEP